MTQAIKTRRKGCQPEGLYGDDDEEADGGDGAGSGADGPGGSGGPPLPRSAPVPVPPPPAGGPVERVTKAIGETLAPAVEAEATILLPFVFRNPQKNAPPDGILELGGGGLLRRLGRRLGARKGSKGQGSYGGMA